MSTFDYTTIFNEYTTAENISFNLLSRAVNFPSDLSLDIYNKVYISKDTTWTILSYKIYGTIDYWWVLSALNKDYMFYAPQGKNIIFITTDYIKDVISAIQNEI